MTNPLAYTTPELPEGAKFKISPSAFSKFVQVVIVFRMVV